MVGEGFNPCLVWVIGNFYSYAVSITNRRSPNHARITIGDNLMVELLETAERASWLVYPLEGGTGP